MNRVRVAVVAVVVGVIAAVGGTGVWAQKPAAGKGTGSGAERTATVDMNVVKPETVGFSASGWRTCMR